ncbi:MAG: hypothetical protein ABJK37_01065 [Paraglaciecola sp.]|uniref:hypothetical protein n=1 Tax=Paraglaciecola sp. TaxID=1920173 RepID=UPI0032972A53
MKNFTRLVFVCLLFTLNIHAFAVPPKVISLDGKLKSLIPANEPGCSVGVFENGKALIKKGYGLANAELNVAMSNNYVQ